MEDSVRLGAVRQVGDRNYTHKLTEEQIAIIRSHKGQKSYRELGAMFGVRPKQIGKIIRGEQWKTGRKVFGGFAPGDPRNRGGYA